MPKDTHRCVGRSSIAQSNIITRVLQSQLGLNTDQVNISIKGIAQRSSTITRKCSVNLSSTHNTNRTKLESLIVDKICDSNQQTNAKVSIPSHICLADPEYNEANEVDILIGAGIFWSLLCIGQHRIDNILLQKTLLGWVVTGLVNQTNHTHSTNIFAVTLEEQLEKF